MQIFCLHTAESNITVFEAAATDLGFPPGVLRHEVRADLLSAAEQAGGLTPEIESKTSKILLELCKNADVVILTCSTLGAAVKLAGKATSVPILRTDDALARKAAETGGNIVALCTAQTTIDSTTRLFKKAAEQFGASADVRLVAGAWTLFKAGNHKGYFETIAKAADEAYDDGATIVALAQASMAGAAKFVRNGPKPISSPIAGLAAAREQCSQNACFKDSIAKYPLL